MTETDIQSKIRQALSEHGMVIRINTGVFKTMDGRMTRAGVPGMPDLLFIGQGFTAFIEVKTEIGRLRPEQERFIARVHALGHRAGVARSVADALQIIGR